MATLDRLGEITRKNGDAASGELGLLVVSSLSTWLSSPCYIIHILLVSDVYYPLLRVFKVFLCHTLIHPFVALLMSLIIVTGGDPFPRTVSPSVDH